MTTLTSTLSKVSSSRGISGHHAQQFSIIIRQWSHLWEHLGSSCHVQYPVLGTRVVGDRLCVKHRYGWEDDHAPPAIYKEPRFPAAAPGDAHLDVFISQELWYTAPVHGT